MDVIDPCWTHYKKLDENDRGTLQIIAVITGNNKNDLIGLGERSSLLPVFCQSIDSQKAAYDQWQTDISRINGQITPQYEEIITNYYQNGGSQNGGDPLLICPEDFQRIFNYMFLIAASASIAVMTPDITLVTDVCMKALTLVFGTIVLPIINLLRVVFIFMLQSLILIVKTAAGVAIEIISNFIKTVYLNIHTIASGAIGIAKVLIYKSLTYCGSFYKEVVTLIPKEKIADVKDLKDKNDKQLTEPTIPSTITTLTQAEVDKINESMNIAVNKELLKPDAVINITEERDIFMDMLSKIGKDYHAIHKNMMYGYSVLKPQYVVM